MFVTTKGTQIPFDNLSDVIKTVRYDLRKWENPVNL